MLRNLDTIYYKPDLVRISQPKLISGRTFIYRGTIQFFHSQKKRIGLSIVLFLHGPMWVHYTLALTY